MRVTVAGTGYVGLVTGVCLAELGHQVTCIDIDQEKINQLQSGESPIYEDGLESLLSTNLSKGKLRFTTDPEIAYSQANLIFIAVGTPEKEDGTADLQFIENVVMTIAANIEQDVIICTKSTVPVGTNEKIKQLLERYKSAYLRTDVVSNPEFLREGSAIYDFYHGDRIVIGAENDESATIVEQLYLPLNIPIIKTDIKSAEMIKYASNAFLATKISFINEIAALCEKVGANIDEVSKGIGKDRRIGPQFLQAGIGYGGSCFPKDTKALAGLAGNVQHPFELLESVIKVNNRQQSLPITKAKEVFGSLTGKKMSLLGLSFKPNTDDIREAASIRMIKELLSEGAIVSVFDPIAMPNVKKIFGHQISYCDDIKDVLKDSELAIIATEWDEIKTAPLYLYETLMKNPILIDGRNCFSFEEIKKHDIHYISIGRPDIIPIKK